MGLEVATWLRLCEEERVQVTEGVPDGDGLALRDADRLCETVRLDETDAVRDCVLVPESVRDALAVADRVSVREPD